MPTSMPIATGSNEDGMQHTGTSQRLTPGTRVIPTCSRDTPSRHHAVTSQVGIGGSDCSKSRENATASPPTPTNKWSHQRGKSKTWEPHEVKDYPRMCRGCSSEPKTP